MRTLVLIVTLALIAKLSSAQTNLDEVKSWKIDGKEFMLSFIDISPDGKTLAIATTQGHGIYIVDLETEKRIKTFDIDDYYAGPIIKYSNKGSYLLLEKQHYNDWNVNKDKAVKYEVMDANTGKIVLKLNDVQDAMISPDERQIAVLYKDLVVFYALPSGKKLNSHNLPGAENSICYTPSGENILISHKFDKEDLKEFPRLQQDKKLLKLAYKTQHTVTEYEVATMLRVRTFRDVFDQVYDMNLSHDNKRVYVMSKQSTKTGGNPYTAFIIIFNLESGEVERGGYYTNKLMGDHGDSQNGKYFGIVNQQPGKWLPEIHVFDPATYDMLTLFKFNKGYFEGMYTRREFSSAQTSFVFSKDEKYMYITMGNMIYKWEIKY